MRKRKRELKYCVFISHICASVELSIKYARQISLACSIGCSLWMENQFENFIYFEPNTVLDFIRSFVRSFASFACILTKDNKKTITIPYMPQRFVYTY